jgi:transcriptional regulator with XRE-family HTH domain
MEILKTIRRKFGLRQQQMATLLGLTRDHYAMMETGKRMLPAPAAQIFADLLPLFLQERHTPTMPEKLPPAQQEELRTLLLQAERELHKTEKELQACTEAVTQLENLNFLLAQITQTNGLGLSARAHKLLLDLSAQERAGTLEKLTGQRLLLHTKQMLCQSKVSAYRQLIEGEKE